MPRYGKRLKSRLKRQLVPPVFVFVNAPLRRRYAEQSARASQYMRESVRRAALHISARQSAAAFRRLHSNFDAIKRKLLRKHGCYSMYVSAGACEINLLTHIRYERACGGKYMKTGASKRAFF